MNAPRLHIDAASQLELLNLLAAIDIQVPLRTEGRTNSHRERYMVARLLATIAESDQISFPLRLEHREKPDFALHLQTGSIGIECVEAVSSEWAQIDAIREQDFPDAMIMLPMLKPGQKSFTLEERVAIAKGERAGPPWVGNMAEHQWAEALSYFIEQKTAKLRAGNYADFQKNWLLIQDEWRVPVYGVGERMKAAKLCAERISHFLQPPSFNAIFICSSKWLMRLAPGPVQVELIRDLWS